VSATSPKRRRRHYSSQIAGADWLLWDRVDPESLFYAWVLPSCVAHRLHGVHGHFLPSQNVTDSQKALELFQQSLAIFEEHLKSLNARGY
jgi:hypothetical protein